MAGYAVVLDANVLYGIEVTDLLLTMAAGRLFRPHWSPQIIDEVTRNLALRNDLENAAIERRVTHMNRALPAALTDIPDGLIDAMPVNEKDRHVLALAVHIGAPTIVTDNLRDFPPNLCDPFNVEAISPDEFTLAQIHLHPEATLSAVDAMAARRKRHPKTRADIIARLDQHLPSSATALLELSDGPA